MGRKKNLDAQSNGVGGYGSGGYTSGGYTSGGYTPGGAGGYTPGGAGGYTPGGAGGYTSGGYTPGGAGGYTPGGQPDMCPKCGSTNVSTYDISPKMRATTCRMCGNTAEIPIPVKIPWGLIAVVIVIMLVVGAIGGSYFFVRAQFKKDTTAFGYYVNAGKYDQAYELANKKYFWGFDASERLAEFNKSINEIVDSMYEGYRDRTVEYDDAKTAIDAVSVYSFDYSDQLREIRNTKKNRDLIEEAKSLGVTEDAFNKLCDVLGNPDYSDSVEIAINMINNDFDGLEIDSNKLLEGYRSARDKYLANPNDEGAEALYFVYKDFYESHLAGEINKYVQAGNAATSASEDAENCGKAGYKLYKDYVDEMLDDSSAVGLELSQARHDIMGCWFGRVEYLYRKNYYNSDDKRSNIFTTFEGLISVYDCFEDEPTYQAEMDVFIDSMKDFYMSLFLEIISGYNSNDAKDFYVDKKTKLSSNGRSDILTLLDETYAKRNK